MSSLLKINKRVSKKSEKSQGLLKNFLILFILTQKKTKSRTAGYAEGVLKGLNNGILQIQNASFFVFYRIFKQSKYVFQIFFKPRIIKTALIVSIGFASSCGTGKWLTPEKIRDPEIRNIYPESPVEEKKLIEKYQGNDKVVKSEIMPGQSVSVVPQPELHIASKPQKAAPSVDEVRSNSRDTNKPKPRKKPPVVYTGNELLRDKEINKNTGIEDVITIIRGSAAVRREQMLMKSHEIRVLGAAGDYIISDYPLTIQDFKSNTTLKAGFGEFISSESRAYFNKKPEVVHINQKTNEKTRIVGDEMERFFKDSLSRVYGHVIIYYPQATAYSARAVYFEPEDKIVLEGNPRIYEKKNIFMADKMTLLKEKKIAILEGNVQVLLTQENKASDSREVVTLITSDYAEYHYGLPVNFADFQTTRKNSFVYVRRKDSETYCRRLIARGDNLDEMELFENLYVLDKENRTRLFGEYGNYSKQEQRARVFTRNDAHGVPVFPVLYFYNKADILTGRMTAEILDRDLEKKMTYGRGNAEFLLYEKTDRADSLPRLQNLAHGAWSEMEDKEKAVYMLGNPYLASGENRIFAAQIVIYPDENRLEMRNSLKGVFDK